MLSLAFAASGGVINNECLVYQGQAIHYVRERMGSLDKAISESTIGAILLIVGVEVRSLMTNHCLPEYRLTSSCQARLGTISQVQLHMGAVQLLIAACQEAGTCLTDGIKRAIFW
jgi:hypothetical protein